MSRYDWCRRTTWTDDDQREFFSRLDRSRSPDSKAQYLRIQAQTLIQVGTTDALRVALSLLERALNRYPNAMDAALAYEAMGQCLHLMSRDGEAIDSFRRALNRQKAFPGIQSNACFSFAKLVAEQRRSDCYDEVLIGLAEFGAAVFPYHAYIINGTRAIIAQERGRKAQAIVLANAALANAEIIDTGLRYHPRVGLVTKKDTQFHKALEKIVGG